MMLVGIILYMEDDVGWDYLVHGSNDCTHANVGKIDTSLKNPYVFLWRRTGGALKDINIECPRCGTEKNFGESYYNKNWKCSGRNPERETTQQRPSRPMTCDFAAKIMQRQAANIRMPEIKTLLSIQSIMTKLHRLVQNEKIKTTIKNATTFLGPLDTEEKMKYMMVSPEEADYEKNKISILSPIGKGLIGHGKGEKLEITVPAGVLKYKILKIKRP